MPRFAFSRSFLMLAVLVLAGAATQIRSGNDEIRWVNRGAGGGGTMHGTAVSPNDANLVLMASDVGGLFRSADGGKTWSLRNGAIVDPAESTQYGSDAVVFAPSNPSIAYYDFFRSTDAGLNWTKWPFQGLAGPHALAPHPTDANIVYAGRDGMIFKVNFNGTPSCTRTCLVSGNPDCSVTNTCAWSGNWTITPPAVRSIAIRPSNPNEILACTDSGLFKSLNGGTTWTAPITSGLPHNNCGRIALRAGTDTLFLTLRTVAGAPDASGWVDVDSWSGGVYKSTGAAWGETWTPVMGSDLNMPEYAVNGNFEQAGDASHPVAKWRVLSGTVQADHDFFHGGGTALQVFSSSAAETDPPVKIQAIDRGALYVLSVWAHSDNPPFNSFPVDIKILYYTDDNGTTPLNWPEQTFNNVEPVGDVNPNTSGWRRYEKLVRIPDQAASYRMWLINNSTGSATTSYDDLSFKRTQSLPKRVGPALTAEPMFVDYSNIVVDPTDSQKVYVETAINRGNALINANDSLYMADSHGVWKTTDGGTSWSHVTRTNYHDNVLDGHPVCGNGVCEGHGTAASEGENSGTCPADCPAGCGDKVCSAGESLANCQVDCPNYTDPPRPWYEAHLSQNGGETWLGEYDGGGLAIGGSGSPGTLYLGNDMYKTTDGGITWQQIAYDPIWPASGKGDASYTARGDASDIYVYTVGTNPNDGNVVYSGTKDLLLQVSRDGGKSFVWEGSPDWLKLGQSNGLGDELAASTINSMIVEPTSNGSVSTIYAGTYVNETAHSSYTNVGGVLRGDYDPATSAWTWSTVGTPASHPKGGAIALARDSSGTFFAGVYGKGLYRLDSNVWTLQPATCSMGANLAPPPNWKIYRLVVDPVTGYLYAASGNPLAYDPNAVEPDPGATGVTGVWESTDHGTSWCKVSDAPMDKEPVVALYVYGNGVVLAGTSYAQGAVGGLSTCPAPLQPFPSNQWTGDGGLYRGCRWNAATQQCQNNPDNPWHWDRILAQPYVSAIAVSPLQDQIVYAQSAQVNNNPVGQCAGIYKSLDGGATWTRLANNGLMNLRYGGLFFSAADPHRIYGASVGSGLFEGTITCGPVAEGFADTDGDGIADCSDPYYDATVDVTPLTFGALTGGTLSSIRSASVDDTYQSFSETSSGPSKLEKVWDFGNLPTGRTYTLNVEAYRASGGGQQGDNFDFKFTAKATACLNTDGNGTTALTVSTPTDNDTLQMASLGTVSSSHVCVQARDANRQGSDTQMDSLSVDRLFLSIPEALTSNDNSVHPVPDPGSIFSGTHLDTRTSNNTREILKESSVQVTGGFTSRLVHTWQFFQVPGTSSHLLHLEGRRPANTEGDNFQFYFSLDGINYTPVGGALISSAVELNGGADYAIPGTGGTWYIQVRDTDATVGATMLDTVEIDQLTIK